MDALADQLLEDVESIASEDDVQQNDPLESEPMNFDATGEKSDKLPSSLPPATTSLVLPLLADILALPSLPSQNQSEYNIVTQSLTAITTIDENIQALHTELKKAFYPGFPELETLVFQPLDYARVVRLTATMNDLSKVDLRSVLPSATVISIHLAFSATAGHPLTSEKLNLVNSLCDALSKLDEWRTTLLAFVEGRAAHMAPNLVAIVGGAVAARLMALAGGLEALAKMPSGYAKLLGKRNAPLQGTSSATTRLHEGVMFTCPLVMALPKSIRSKAGEVLSGKACLAARVDACRSKADDSMGRAWRKKLEEKYEKWLEPSQARTLKPLAKPGKAAQKHRGGRRARNQKDSLAVTNVRKLANRVKFGEEEVMVGNDLEQEGLGMLGAEDSGQIRVRVKKTNNLSAAAKRRLEKQKKREKRSEAEELGISGDNILLLNPARALKSSGTDEGKSTNPKSSYFSAATPFAAVQSRKDSKLKHGLNGNVPPRQALGEGSREPVPSVGEDQIEPKAKRARVDEAQ